MIKTPRWRKKEYPNVKDPKVKTLKPDLVCIYPIDEQKKIIVLEYTMPNITA